jgi:16S rRNA (guanine1207-N2)-methyltransferase
MRQTETSAVYGAPPAELVAVDRSAVQLSPLVPGAAVLEDVAPATFDHFAMLAPAGRLERRYALALALRSTKPGAAFTALAAKDKGGLRLAEDLAALGCDVTETARRHHRICALFRPETINGVDAAIAEGGPRILSDVALWSQPGLFNWDRIDPGSALLAAHLTDLKGAGADLGSGLGILAKAAFASPAVRTLTLIDIDRRAIEVSRRNVTDPRATFRWADVTKPHPSLTDLDFVIMNPPFHDGGVEDRALGLAFIRRAAEMLRTGGRCWLVANRHLPYEATIRQVFKRFDLRADAAGFKVYEAIR